MRVYFQDGEGAVLGATFMQNHAYIIFSTRVLNTRYSLPHSDLTLPAS